MATISLGNVLVSASFLTAAVVFARTEDAKDLQARSLTLVDAQGMTAAQLSITPNGPALVTFREGKLRTVISSAGFQLFDSTGVQRIGLVDGGEAGVGFAFSDAKGRLKLMLRSGSGGMGFGGESSISFYDEGSIMRGQVRFEESAGMMVGLHDKKGELRAGLRLDKREDGALLFLDEDGERARAELLMGFRPDNRKPTIEAYWNDKAVHDLIASDALPTAPPTAPGGEGVPRAGKPTRRGGDASAGLPGDPVTGEPVVSSTGLKYYDITVGTGLAPTGKSARVKVHYTGWLINGTKCESSLDSGQPALFALNGVIPGWTEGLGSMKVGGKRKLVIPAPLGYGAQGRPPLIPPNSTLVYDVELLEIIGP